MKEVLEFYKNIPFNYSDDINFFTDNIKQYNQVFEYQDLHKLCLSRKNIFGKYLIKDVIEFGCGTGWLTNTLSYTYKKNLTSVDFTEKAIKTAKLVSNSLNVSPCYFKSDIFNYEDSKKYDLVISMGVLHHTKNCKKAFEKISKFVKPGGYLYVGLYHLYGRKPMLDFLQGFARWHGIDSAYKLFCYMSKDMNNQQHSFSWFRDQVLHPHETQHTFIELKEWVENIGFKLKSTSINNYDSLKNYSDQSLSEIEKSFQQSSYKKNVLDLKFSPGYFTICAQK